MAEYENHDLLIQVATKVEMIEEDVKEIRKQMAKVLEYGIRFDEYQKNRKWYETKLLMLMGVIATVVAAVVSAMVG